MVVVRMLGQLCEHVRIFTRVCETFGDMMLAALLRTDDSQVISYAYERLIMELSNSITPRTRSVTTPIQVPDTILQVLWLCATPQAAQEQLVQDHIRYSYRIIHWHRFDHFFPKYPQKSKTGDFYHSFST